MKRSRVRLDTNCGSDADVEDDDEGTCCNAALLLLLLVVDDGLDGFALLYEDC